MCLHINFINHSRAATGLEVRLRIPCKRQGIYSLILLLSASLVTWVGFYFINNHIIYNSCVYVSVRVWKAHACSYCIMYNMKWFKFNSNMTPYLETKKNFISLHWCIEQWCWKSYRINHLFIKQSCWRSCRINHLF